MCCTAAQSFSRTLNDFLESHANRLTGVLYSIDIERFKLFNNWYGQEAGDILLTQYQSVSASYSADERLSRRLFWGRSFLHVYSGR